MPLGSPITPLPRELAIRMRQSIRFLTLAAVAAAVVFTALASQADVCNLSDTGGGTVELPFAPCEYTSPFDHFEIVDGLPPGTTIVLEPVLHQFQCIAGSLAFCSGGIAPGFCEVAGGALGGTRVCSKAELELTIYGTGLLAGYNRLIVMPVDIETHHGLRTPFDPVQTSPTDVHYLSGDIFGDPDFDLLQLRAGSAFGHPSPGQMTLGMRAADLGWRGEETLELGYEITFIGAPGSILEGMSGVTSSSVDLEVGRNTCIAPDSGTGTVELPGLVCDAVNDDPQDPYLIVDGLPPGTTIVLEAVHRDFSCAQFQPSCSVALPPGTCEAPGGGLGGNINCHHSTMQLDVRGTGLLAGFSRTLWVSLEGEFHTGPRNPGDPVQQFSQEIAFWQGQIFGDPDFCTFSFRTGALHGLPTPGIGRLTEQPDGSFAVDSFFDIAYEIDFQGCPGSILEGFAGTTSSSVPVTIGQGPLPDPVPGLTGSWLALAAGLLCISSVWVIRVRFVRA